MGTIVYGNNFLIYKTVSEIIIFINFRTYLFFLIFKWHHRILNIVLSFFVLVNYFIFFYIKTEIISSRVRFLNIFLIFFVHSDPCRVFISAYSFRGLGFASLLLPYQNSPLFYFFHHFPNFFHI